MGLFAGCGQSGENRGFDQALVTDTLVRTDSAQAYKPAADHTLLRDTALVDPLAIDTKGIKPDQVVQFAQGCLGIPYKYGEADPGRGFDCSGFITYIFKNFGISVPRSSVGFTNVGRTVSMEEARPGDLILFTGTAPEEREIGHMGLVVSNTGGMLEFEHATSGKAMSVVITPFNDYYRTRFVRVTRIFP
jgi:cell wall-associated NlpC family hydrolase